MTHMRLGFCAVAAVLAFTAFPRVVQGQRSGIEIWAATCGNCHLVQPAERYSAKDWDAIGTHMVITARLTDAQATAVMEFLKGNAMRLEGGASNDAVRVAAPLRTQRSDPAVFTPAANCCVRVVLGLGASVGPVGLAAQQPEPKEQYRKLCAPCHGATGRGDGPAAMAMTPKPGNFTDSSLQASLTDEQLVKVITEGKPPMPAFGRQLSPSQIKALADYVRELGKTPR